VVDGDRRREERQRGSVASSLQWLLERRRECRPARGTLLKVSDLVSEDVELFRGFIRMADKAAAPVTLPLDHPWQRSYEAIMRIL
jgi:hypothetical protein